MSDKSDKSDKSDIDKVDEANSQTSVATADICILHPASYSIVNDVSRTIVANGSIFRAVILTKKVPFMPAGARHERGQ